MADQNENKALTEKENSSKGFVKLLGSFLPEIILLCIFIFIYTLRLNLDFWNDEIYSLRHFTFTSLQKTVSSYPVPNNHVLFNLIDNIYLKIIGIDSFAVLIEHPWKLRILFFLYALLTFIFTYRIGRKFFNHYTARLATIILITTIPFFNFALQARGYGLSTLLLVWILYGCLSYQKSQNRRWLWFVFISTAAAVYTVPSNLLPIGAFLFPYGIFFMFDLFRFRKSIHPAFFGALCQNISLHLILTMVLGIGMALVCYLPIFNDVFFNEYATTAVPFDLPKLNFYFDHIGEGSVSGRWIIIGLSFVGLLVAGVWKNRLRPVLLILSVCFLPILVIYVQGVKPPLRAFVYFPPFMALLIGMGLEGFMRRFLPKGKIFALFFLGAIAIYALVIMYFQFQKIDTHLENDIRVGKRSQDMYAQYYSDRYEPLNAVKRLRSLLAKDSLPVLISGCEPHGVPTYFRALDVPFHRLSELDDLLSTHDSIYIMTNHPTQYLHLSEYHTEVLNEPLNYHNILLFSKSGLYYTIEQKMDSLLETYGDSVGFVLKVFSEAAYSNFDRRSACYFISDSLQEHIGSLVDFASRKSYLWYADLMGDGSVTVEAIVTDERKPMDLPAPGDTLPQYFGKRTAVDWRNTNDTTDIAFAKRMHLLAERLDSTSLFSISYSTVIGKLPSVRTLKISVDASFQANTESKLVISIVRHNEPVVWLGIPLKSYFLENQEWQRIIAAYSLPNDLLDGDQLGIYVWNPEKEIVMVDNLTVEPFRFSGH